MSVAAASTAIVWALSERTIVQGAGAGGERPLAVFAFGSGAARSALVGAVVAPEPLVELVVVVPDALDSPVDEPDAPVGSAPVALVGVCAVADVVELPLVVEVTPAGVLDVGAVTDGVPLELVEVVVSGPAVVIVVPEGAERLAAAAGSLTPGAAGAASDGADADTEPGLLAPVAAAAGSAAAPGAGCVTVSCVAAAVNEVVTGPPPKSLPDANESVSVPPAPESAIGAGAAEETTVCSPASSPAKAIWTVPATATGPADSNSGVDSLTATTTVPPGARAVAEDPRSTPAARSTETDATTSITPAAASATGNEV
jgi:hypothetical protein